MPFFCRKGNTFEFSTEKRKKILKRDSLVNSNKKQKNVTLQVRIPTAGRISFRNRVSFFASASMTIEASLALPFLLFAGVLLLMPFRILDVERQVQAHVETVGEDISQLAYFSMENTAGREALTAVTAYGYAEAAVRVKLKDLPVKNLSLASSELLKDGETVNLVVDYEMKLPFSVFGLENVKRRSGCYRRAWIGVSGNNRDGQAAEGDTEDKVFVGRNSTRYHTSRTCHYLYNNLKAVSLAKIEDYRNQGGGRYTPCSRCGRHAGGSVYIMPSGSHYHSSSSCTAIQAYVTEVPKSQVEHLGPCSYCGGGH